MIICSNGNKAWFFGNNLHEIDGPAIRHSNGDSNSLTLYIF